VEGSSRFLYKYSLWDNFGPVFLIKTVKPFVLVMARFVLTFLKVALFSNVFLFWKSGARVGMPQLMLEDTAK
jgi:uncharacterized membrane protein